MQNILNLNPQTIIRILPKLHFKISMLSSKDFADNLLYKSRLIDSSLPVCTLPICTRRNWFMTFKKETINHTIDEYSKGYTVGMSEREERFIGNYANLYKQMKRGENKNFYLKHTLEIKWTFNVNVDTGHDFSFCEKGNKRFRFCNWPSCETKEVSGISLWIEETVNKEISPAYSHRCTERMN